MTKKYIQYSDIIKQFHEALAELDARYQDGTIAPSDEIEQLERVSEQIHGYASSMANDNGWREANRKGAK